MEKYVESLLCIHWFIFKLIFYQQKGAGMPSLSVNSIPSFFGVVALLAGSFLILTGLGIVKIEKITVTPGKLTWGFGILLSIVGIVLLWPEIQSYLSNGNAPAPTSTAIVLESTEASQQDQQGECGILKLDAIHPPTFLENEPTQYKLMGSGFCNGTAIVISTSARVGSSPQSINSQPSEVSSDGTWLTVYINPVPEPDQDGAYLTVENPGGNTASLYVDYQR
ncbi:MAG: hypothetical protein E4G99_03660 [Anaerolineales bacterium]|nr:MAG: hypothetical protein E4G99_03660 [Anaerolineales bacterium]